MSSKRNITTPFRITRDEALLIRFGLLRLVIAHHRWQDRGAPLVSPRRNTTISISGPRDEGEFSPDCQATVLRVYEVATNSFNAQSRRLHLDAIELAGCILGVRATEMMARHGHLEPCPANYKARCRRLITKLERLRKRAKRAYFRVHGQKAFAELSYRWQQYVRFARSFFLYCTCNRTILPDPSGKRRRKLIQDQWVEYLREELPERGLKVPPEPELRDLIKRAMRVGKRFIRQYGRMTARKNHDTLQERMVSYVARRCAKSKV